MPVLTVAQNLRVFGMLYGVRDLEPRIDALLDQFDLARLGDQMKEDTCRW